MELLYTKNQEEYIKLIKGLEEDLKISINSSGETDLDLYIIQQRLDAIAHEYQHSEKIGTARYKLYELQAFIFYFEHQDDKALDFINQAIELRGGIYQKAEKLKENIASKNKAKTLNISEVNMTKAEKRKMLIGVEGWLAWAVVGLFISIAQTVFNFFYSGIGLAQSDILLFNEYQTGLGDSLQTMIAFENFGLVIFISLLLASVILILRRKKLAKTIMVVTLIYGVVYNTMDYAAASSLFGSTDLIQYIQSDLNDVANSIGRCLVSAAIWIPYFMTSKRVKATLIK